MMEFINLCYRCTLAGRDCEATQKRMAGWMCAQCIAEAHLAELEWAVANGEGAALREVLLRARATVTHQAPRIILNIQ